MQIEMQESWDIWSWKNHSIVRSMPLGTQYLLGYIIISILRVYLYPAIPMPLFPALIAYISEITYQRSNMPWEVYLSDKCKDHDMRYVDMR